VKTSLKKEKLSSGTNFHTSSFESTDLDLHDSQASLTFLDYLLRVNYPLLILQHISPPKPSSCPKNIQLPGGSTNVVLEGLDAESDPGWRPQICPAASNSSKLLQVPAVYGNILY
jgi:hypothetical protein